jgi:hydrogenase maturation factor
MSLPAKVINVSGTDVTVELNGAPLQVRPAPNMTLVPGAWVLINADQVIDEIDEDEAIALKELLDELIETTTNAL